MKKKILFYLEPVLFRNEPGRLHGWYRMFENLARASHREFDSYVAGSYSCLRIASDAFTDTFELNSSAFVSEFGYDRSSYSRDLFRPSDGRMNRELMSSLLRIRASLNPDVIISLSENRYLKEAFHDRLVVFTEFGPLPKLGMKDTAFFDPFGHQVDCAFDMMVRRGWRDESLSRFADIWAETWEKKVRDAAESRGLDDWWSRAIGARPSVLVALQPPDWLTYEGPGPRIDNVALLKQISENLPPDHVVVPQWHPSEKVPTDDLMEEITYFHKNIVFVPSEFRGGKSEEILNKVQLVVSLSSNVSAIAAVMGKRLKIVGDSKFHSLDGRQETRRTDLLAFMICNYCKDMNSMMTKEGAFSAILEKYMSDEESILRPDDLDPEKIYDFMID